MTVKAAAKACGQLAIITLILSAPGRAQAVDAHLTYNEYTRDPDCLGSVALNLFDLMKLWEPRFSPEQAKVHLARYNGEDHPLDVFIQGGFEASGTLHLADGRRLEGSWKEGQQYGMWRIFLETED